LKTSAVNRGIVAIMINNVFLGLAMGMFFPLIPLRLDELGVGAAGLVGLNAAAAWPAPTTTIGLSTACALFGFGNKKHQAIQFRPSGNLATESAIVATFDVGHFEHGIFDFIDFAGFCQPRGIDEYMAGSAGQAAAAFAFYVRDIISGRRFHQVQAVFDIDGYLIPVFGFPGDIYHRVCYLIKVEPEIA
jgi:hypothetical protein